MASLCYSPAADAAKKNFCADPEKSECIKGLESQIKKKPLVEFKETIFVHGQRAECYKQSRKFPAMFPNPSQITAYYIVHENKIIVILLELE